ncbi:hypothetical protein BDQ12DRAFT_722645 [Crucibulum laeve]|uniref:Uncharacterized protein n=1 Tax=Crucibulum laeve TaxID=68775 RepID=A0A5C3M366_9AGAR|nr:hypothetical protein BDQ12DRAFT_722645 [Crucibulum laeve]
MAGKKPIKPTDAARIQSTQAKAGADTGKSSFPARAQAGAANNVNKGTVEKPVPGVKTAKGSKK